MSFHECVSNSCFCHWNGMKKGAKFWIINDYSCCLRTNHLRFALFIIYWKRWKEERNGWEKDFYHFSLGFLHQFIRNGYKFILEIEHCFMSKYRMHTSSSSEKINNNFCPFINYRLYTQTKLLWGIKLSLNT